MFGLLCFCTSFFENHFNWRCASSQMICVVCGVHLLSEAHITSSLLSTRRFQLIESRGKAARNDILMMGGSRRSLPPANRTQARNRRHPNSWPKTVIPGKGQRISLFFVSPSRLGTATDSRRRRLKKSQPDLPESIAYAACDQNST